MCAGFARLDGRAVAAFLDEAEDEDVLVALCRVAEAFQGGPQIRREIVRYVALCREGTELERRLGLLSRSGTPGYDLPASRNPIDAVEQEGHVAAEERQRLGIGYHPMPDMADLVAG